MVKEEKERLRKGMAKKTELSDDEVRDKYSGLMQKSHNSSALAIDLHFFCIEPLNRILLKDFASMIIVIIS